MLTWIDGRNVNPGRGGQPYLDAFNELLRHPGLSDQLKRVVVSQSDNAIRCNETIVSIHFAKKVLNIKGIRDLQVKAAARQATLGTHFKSFPSLMLEVILVKNPECWLKRESIKYSPALVYFPDQRLTHDELREEFRSGLRTPE